jgi:hypothetical protein
MPLQHVGSGGIAPSFFTLALDVDVWQASCPGHSTPKERLLGATGYKTWWDPELVWMLYSTKKCLAPAWNCTPAIQPVARHYTN